MSFGNRLGVNCTRWKAASIDLVRALASVVFPTSETSSIEAETPARMAIIKTSIVSPLLQITAARLFPEPQRLRSRRATSPGRLSGLPKSPIWENSPDRPFDPVRFVYSRSTGLTQLGFANRRWHAAMPLQIAVSRGAAKLRLRDVPGNGGHSEEGVGRQS
jgi:hypothetical protein